MRYCYFYENHIFKGNLGIYFCKFRVFKKLILVKSVKIQIKRKEIKKCIFRYFLHQTFTKYTKNELNNENSVCLFRFFQK